ncbi:MAG TPA: HAMP domain-containing sensor histidine kinase [Methanoregulaceae archaeon]|nr:HAMP domain-containing sensor histidine kinase [Methanoregulaceae archaeon]
MTEHEPSGAGEPGPGRAGPEPGGLWWQRLHEPRPYAFIILVLLGLALEFFVHYHLGIAVVYTHFYYLIIVLAGLWYGRRAVLIALFFGSLHIGNSFLTTGSLSPDALIRACMFVLVAFVVGIISEQVSRYRDRILAQNRELLAVNARLESSQKAFEIANKKLNLLSSITRHDIKNQLVVLIGYNDIMRGMTTDPEMQQFLNRQNAAAQTIQRQIEFTRTYEDIGVRAPMWQDIGTQVAALAGFIPPGEVAFSVSIEGLEVYADPLLEKVFENMIDNSRRHGERVRHISLSSQRPGPDNLIIVYEDDGVGVPEGDKERIFEKGFGKHTGLGLFLSREILAITGLSIQECGVYGRGARFEILVPKGKYRFVNPAPGSR